MKKSIYKNQGILRVSKGIVFTVVLFVVFMVFILIGVTSLAGRNKDEELQIAEDSINKAIMTCYAVEGKYPKSYEYLEKNYGVHINNEKYIVSYEIFASNIFPNVMVVER